MRYVADLELRRLAFREYNFEGLPEIRGVKSAFSSETGQRKRRFNFPAVQLVLIWRGL